MCYLLSNFFIFVVLAWLSFFFDVLCECRVNEGRNSRVIIALLPHSLLQKALTIVFIHNNFSHSDITQFSLLFLTLSKHNLLSCIITSDDDNNFKFYSRFMYEVNIYPTIIFIVILVLISSMYAYLRAFSFTAPCPVDSHLTILPFISFFGCLVEPHVENPIELFLEHLLKAFLSKFYFKV